MGAVAGEVAQDHVEVLEQPEAVVDVGDGGLLLRVELLGGGERREGIAAVRHRERARHLEVVRLLGRRRAGRSGRGSRRAPRSGRARASSPSAPTTPGSPRRRGPRRGCPGGRRSRRSAGSGVRRSPPAAASQPSRGAPARADGADEVDRDGRGDEDHQRHAQEDEGIADRRGGAAAPAATMPAATGFRKLRRRLSAEARRHAMSGPTPIRKSRARKTGMLTRLKNGAPTLTLTPRSASESSGKDGAEEHGEGGGEEEHVVEQEDRLARDRRSRARPVARRRSKRQASRPNEPRSTRARKARKNWPTEPWLKAWTEPMIPERVRNVPNSVRPKVRMMRAQVPELEHAPPLLDHHRVQERGGGEPGHEGRVLHGVPRPVAAPAEDVVAPPAADEEPEREEVPGDDRPAARDRDPLVARAPDDQRGHGEGEGHREAREAQVEGHGVGDHARVLEERVEAAAVGGHRG